MLRFFKSLFLLLFNFFILQWQQETETKLSSRLSEVQQEHKRYLESLQVQQSKVAEQLHKEMEIQASKLQEEIARRENDKQQQIALGIVINVSVKSKFNKLMHFFV